MTKGVLVGAAVAIDLVNTALQRGQCVVIGLQTTGEAGVNKDIDRWSHQSHFGSLTAFCADLGLKLLVASSLLHSLV